MMRYDPLERRRITLVRFRETIAKMSKLLLQSEASYRTKGSLADNQTQQQSSSIVVFAVKLRRELRLISAA